MQSADPASPLRLPLRMVLFVAALAFLLASFPARNSDLWAHLAAGRELVHGGFSGGATSGPTDGINAHQNWLYDLLAYGLYSTIGGSGLVFGKALVVVALALVVFRISRTGPGIWTPLICTTLAILAVGVRALLQPATLSYLLFALALWLVLRQKQAHQLDPPSYLPPWQLMLLFVVWANLDDWFVLGLASLLLWWVGEAFDRGGTTGSRWNNLLRHASALTILVAVCLLNPSGVWSFALPSELAILCQANTEGSLGAFTAHSPFGAAFIRGVGSSPVGLAYFPLLALGLVSFLINMRHWRWQLFLPWLGLAAVSIIQARAIPFFAAVGGPVLAWNLEAYLANRPERVGGHRPMRTNATGEALAGLLGVGLLVCAWPGWLQLPPYEPRRWVVEVNPAVELGSEAVRDWHQRGKFGKDSRALHLSPESAAAFAWFCPEEKALIALDFTASLLGGERLPDGLAEQLLSGGVDHLVVYDPNLQRHLILLERLLSDPDRWPLLVLKGRLAVFGCINPDRALADNQLSEPGIDIAQAAFGLDARRAPGRPGYGPPSPRGWWEAFWKPAPRAQLDREEATVYMLLADALRQSAARRNALIQVATIASGVATAAAPVIEQVAYYLHTTPLERRDETPAAPLYLALRAARRALAANPDDAQSCLILGNCYLRLLHTTREREWVGHFKELTELRRSQACATLNRAVLLDPTLAPAHQALGALYREIGYLDLALHHLQAYRDLTRPNARTQQAEIDQMKAQADRIDNELRRLSQIVQAAQQSYERDSARLRPVDRALLALQKGLAGKARDMLLESDIAAFGSQGLALELDLLLRTGRPREVVEWTVPDHKSSLGAGQYHWIRSQAFAAGGEYALAVEELGLLARAENQMEALGPRAIATGLIGQAILDAQPAGKGIANFLWGLAGRMDLENRLAVTMRSLRREADAHVLQGLIALEEGQIEEADIAFRLALSIWKDAASVRSGTGLDFSGRPIAQECLTWLK